MLRILMHEKRDTWIILPVINKGEDGMALSFNEQFEKMMREYDVTEVVLLGHMNPDGDAAGSVMGLAHYIKVNYPQYTAWPFLSDKLDKGPKKQVMEDEILLLLSVRSWRLKGMR